MRSASSDVDAPREKGRPTTAVSKVWLKLCDSVRRSLVPRNLHVVAATYATSAA